MDLKPRQSIKNLKPYQNGNHSKHLFDLGQRVIKLDSNEATGTPSPRVMIALSEFIQSSNLNWYPDVCSTELINKLSHYTKLPSKFLQTFNGSDHALETICRTFLGEKDEVIVCAPSYDHFRVYAESCGAEIKNIFGPTPYLNKKDFLISQISPKTKMIYIVNPNNPTGFTYSGNEIRQILNQSPQTLVIVDEAYFEFSKNTVIQLVLQFKNLIVTRSFSKAFGLAGLRVGYMAACESILAPINKIRVGKHVNSLGQVAACASLDDVEYMERYVSEVHASKAWLVEKIQSLNLVVISTPANFILVKVANPEALVEHLASQNIFIRDRSKIPQLEGFVRISIGHQLLMERFWKVFKEISVNLLQTSFTHDLKNQFTLAGTIEINQA
ncbi:MAG: hypothetical protein ACD_73C00097G0001 [uncultured bacterium]|nr:MAG: hypothetical protein ACD_73C00097G0001 [uncultured bacterium]